MNSKDIDLLLREGEGLRIEFKSTFDNKVIETLAAFANTSGGSVLIGITDDRKV
jgi:predicted HTH transcriptional regulator